MEVSQNLEEAFSALKGSDFERAFAEFLVQRGLIPKPEDLRSVRFLSRAVAPHVRRLSEIFNRLDEDVDVGGHYWSKSSNPENFRLAYFLYFMPANLFRMASIFAELSRLGYKVSENSASALRRQLKVIEFGAGPATAACGAVAGEAFAPIGLPAAGEWRLVERDRWMGEIGEAWFSFFQGWLGRSGHFASFRVQPIKDLKDLLLQVPKRGEPRFDLFLSSFFLNERKESAADLAKGLMDFWDRGIEDEGLIIICEPALKVQSRRLLELRKEIIARTKERKLAYQVLLPCLGHQACGALENPEDWCHEEVSWWRPDFIKKLDELCELDRKSLPFSYLVIAKSRRPRSELLPNVPAKPSRLVSPVNEPTKGTYEYFICNENGKRRARSKDKKSADLDRGSIIS